MTIVQIISTANYLRYYYTAFSYKLSRVTVLIFREKNQITLHRFITFRPTFFNPFLLPKPNGVSISFLALPFSVV